MTPNPEGQGWRGLCDFFGPRTRMAGAREPDERDDKRVRQLEGRATQTANRSSRSRLTETKGELNRFPP
jgi:hypothetical protein